MTVPFVDLKQEYLIAKAEIDALMREVIENTAFIGGKMVNAFETEMAAHQQTPEIVSAACATSALHLTLRALGIGPGDEVITTPCTAIPTSEAITLAGARVVFADIDPATFSLSPAAAAAKVTNHTKAILIVHLYGIPCDLDAFAELARARRLLLIEDCAQAQGARWRGKRVGNFGDAAAFSFFPSKNLGCFGDGGAMTAADPQIRQRQRCLANHGRQGKYDHVLEGTNSRLDALQAAVLRPKLKLLDERNALRRKAAAWYYEELDGVPGLHLPTVPPQAEPVWHIFPVRVADRDGLAAHLKARGIETGLHYSKALHLQPAYAQLQLPAGALPQAEAAFAEELSLPMFPGLTREQVGEVSRAVREFLKA